MRRLRWPTAFAALLIAWCGTTSANITDNFDRADNAQLGNGWIEKNAGAFALSGNAAPKQSVSSGYRDNLVYRPAAEDVTNVEASVEFRLTSSSPGYPQILVRIQSGTAGFSDYLDGYILYVSNSSTNAVLGRQTGSSFVTALAPMTISPALNTTDTYRLRLSANGTNPVQLAATIERLNGGVWQAISQATYNDSSAERFASAGSVGFGGYVESSYRYDNFVRTNLTGGPNPVPILGSLSPSSALAGESGLTLTVSGNSFTSGSIVRWNGADRPTAFISATTLEATIGATDLATAGSASVTVFNPTPGGGTSNALTFTINPNVTPNPVPTATSLLPSSAAAGGAGFTLTVNGAGFASNATVRWNGADRTTTFISATELRATIPSGDIASTGSATVTVFNPTPGGGTSNGLQFSINAPASPVPATTSINPSSASAGAAAFTLTVNGNNFVNGSTVRWNGANRTTTFISAGELRASIPASDVAFAGTASVTVFTPTPGGGTSNGQTFTINAAVPNNPSPAVTSLNPTSVFAGSGTQQITINGSGFISGSVARWNGNNRTTNFVSSAQIRITLTSADVANAGIGSVTVFNPSPGGGASAPMTLFILVSGQSFFFDGFNRADSPSIGNSWIEKLPQAFYLQGGAVRSTDTPDFEYPDSITYRPLVESQRDVEVSVEFVRQPSIIGPNFPQLHARVQGDTVAQADTLHSYIFFVYDFAPYNGQRAMFAIQPPLAGEYECYLAAFDFPSELVNGNRYRLRFRVSGVAPVQLTGFVDSFDGERWQVFASGSTTHSSSTQIDPVLGCPVGFMPAPIVNAGSAGFAKWRPPTDFYDNFYWLQLNPGQNPTPVLNSVLPSLVPAGSGAFTLTVSGLDFLPSSTVRWNGQARTTTYVSATELRADILAADVTQPGTFPVTVVNPSPGGGTSQAQNVVVQSAPSGGSSWLDDFQRADSGTLGNGWIEKTASAFFLSGGRAAKQDVSSGYRDNIVYRPATENLLDVEASVEFRLSSSSPGYPQVFTRVQTSTVAVTDQLDAYILYVTNSNTQAILGRQTGNSFVTALATLSLSSALSTTDTFRLRLRSTGSTSVQLNAFVERWNGSAWVAIGSASVTDSSGSRIANPGSVGFGGFVEPSYSFDNFRRTNLAP